MLCQTDWAQAGMQRERGWRLMCECVWGGNVGEFKEEHDLQNCLNTTESVQQQQQKKNNNLE